MQRATEVYPVLFDRFLLSGISTTAARTAADVEVARQIELGLIEDDRPKADLPVPQLHSLPGGATRSEKAPDHSMVPGALSRRVALRFELGATTHGRDNWKKSLTNEYDARDFCQEAMNHLHEHLLKYQDGTDPSDDHLGAIGWGIAVIAYTEEKFGKPWTQLKHRDDIPF